MGIIWGLGQLKAIGVIPYERNQEMTDHQKDQIAKAKAAAETSLESPFHPSAVTMDSEAFLALLREFEAIETQSKIIKGNAQKIEEIAEAIAKRCET